MYWFFFDTNTSQDIFTQLYGQDRVTGLTELSVHKRININQEEILNQLELKKIETFY
jgi:hypothetical protein